jgi:predicted DNA-binding protein YlxM (UPF0122 family)
VGKRARGDSVYNAVHSNYLIEEIFHSILDNPSATQEEVAEGHEVSRAVVMDICSCSKYKWLQDKYPDKYLELLSRKGRRKEIKDSLRKLPKVLSPSGEVYEVANITSFAKQHNIDPGALGKVIRGKIPHAKKWVLLKDTHE